MAKTKHPQLPDAKLVIIGGGGHTRVLIGILQSMALNIHGIITQDKALLKQKVLGIKVLGLETDFDASPTAVMLINGVGNHASKTGSGLNVRAEIAARYKARGFTFGTIVSPYACVSHHANITEGVQIFQRTVVQPGVQIGAHSIINSGAIIEHDTRIGDYCHIAPAAVLCGNVCVGNFSHIGANATVIQGRSVPENSVIAAGAVVR